MKRDLVVGRWNDQGVAVPTRARAGRDDRAADLDWRAKADEGGCADWGLAFARIPAAPQREDRNPRTQLRRTVFLILLATAAAAVLIAEGRIVWPL